MGFSPQSARSTAHGSGRHTGHHHQPASQFSSFLRKKLFRVSRQSTRPLPSPTPPPPHEDESSVPLVRKPEGATNTQPFSPKAAHAFYRSKPKMLMARAHGKDADVAVPLMPTSHVKPQQTPSFLSKTEQMNPAANPVQQDRCALQELRNGGSDKQHEEPREDTVHLKQQQQREEAGRCGEMEAAKGCTRKHTSKATVAALASEQEEKVRELKEAVRFYKHQLDCGYRNHVLTMEQMKSATEVFPEEQRDKAFQRYAEAYAEVLTEHLRARRTPATLAQYEFIQTLGHGGFGAVYLVRKKSDGQYFALKQVPKRKVLKASSRERQLAERNFLSVSRCPSIVQLHATFQDELFLYQVGEFLQGGSLMHYMHAKQKFPEDVVKMCIAELVLAVKEVHDRGYIHRDIKPDNIVFTRDGHLKLLDFGLAKFAPLVFQRGSHKNMKCCPIKSCSHVKNPPKSGASTTTTSSSTAASPNFAEAGVHLPSSPEGTNFLPCPVPTGGCSACACGSNIPSEAAEPDALSRPSDTLLKSICGTPMYTAPEVLRGEGYENSVDWWSVGVVMFEMLYGGIPFCPPPKYRGDVATFVKVQVTNHALVCPIPYPSPISNVLSAESVSFMQSLVCEPQQRLKSAFRVMQHPWFADMQWHGVHRMRSPLREDTEQYAQKHFSHLSPETTSSASFSGVGASACSAPASGKQVVPSSGNATRRLKFAVPAGGRDHNLPAGSRIVPPATGAAAGGTAAAAMPRLGGRPAREGSGSASSSSSYAVTEHDLFFSRYAFSRKAVDTVPTFSKVLHRTAEKYPIIPPPTCSAPALSTTSRDPHSHTVSTTTPPLTDSLQSFNCTSSGFCPSSGCSCECSLPASSTSSSSCCNAEYCARQNISKRSPPLLRQTELLVAAVSDENVQPATGETQKTAANLVKQGIPAAAGSPPTERDIALGSFATLLDSDGAAGADAVFVRKSPEPGAPVASAALTVKSALEKGLVETHRLAMCVATAPPETRRTEAAASEKGADTGAPEAAAIETEELGKYVSAEVGRAGAEGQAAAAATGEGPGYYDRERPACILFQQTGCLLELPGTDLHAQALAEPQLHSEVNAVNARKNCRTEASSCLPSPAPSTRASCGSPVAAQSSTHKSTQIKEALERQLQLHQHEVVAEKGVGLRQDEPMREKQTRSQYETSTDQRGLVILKEHVKEQPQQQLAASKIVLTAQPDVESACQAANVHEISVALQGLQKSTIFAQNQQQVQQQGAYLASSKNYRRQVDYHKSEERKLAPHCEARLQNAYLMPLEGQCNLLEGQPFQPRDGTRMRNDSNEESRRLLDSAFESTCLPGVAAPTKCATVVAESHTDAFLGGAVMTAVTQRAAGKAQDLIGKCSGASAATPVNHIHIYSKEVTPHLNITSGGPAMCPVAGSERRAC